MKTHRLPLVLTLLVLGSFFLSACTGTLVHSWPGVSAAQNTIYLANQGQVFAINADNGSPVWKFPEKADASKPFYAAPAVSQNLIVAGNYGHMLYGLDPSNGAQKWVFDTQTGNFAGTPLIVKDTVLAPSSSGKLYALSTDGKPLWEYTTNNSLWTTPVSDGTNVYLAALDHNLYALNLSNGSLVWKKDMGSALTAAPVLTPDGTLYVSALEGDLSAVKASDGSVLWTTNTGGRIWATPVLHDNTLYVGNAANIVVAVSAKDGSVVWKQDAGSPIIGGGVVLQDGIAFPTEGGSVIAWSLDGQKQLWSQPIGGKLYTTPVVAGQTAVVAVMEGDKLLQAINPNGQLSWTFVQPK